MRRLLAALLVLAGAAACGESVDPAYLVKDLRVLAVQAEPPEVLYSDATPASFSFSALVVDPEGGSVDYHWSFCPVESDKACLDYAQKRDLPLLTGQTPSDAMLASLDAMHAIASTGSALPLPESQGLSPAEAATRAVWPYDVPSFAIDAPAELYAYHVQASLLGQGMGAWPSATLELTSATQTLRVTKRVVLNVADPAAFAGPFAAVLGITLCPDPNVPDDPLGCLAVRPRTANRNPTFSEVRIARSDLATATFEPLVGTPDVQAGESIRLLPVLNGDAYESYQVFRFNLESREIFVDESVEDPSVSWFCSAGSLQEQVTWPKLTRSLDTVYTAPDTPPAATGGLVTVWMVARDERGGVGWQSVELHITP